MMIIYVIAQFKKKKQRNKNHGINILLAKEERKT